jgi:hypothetical protein
MINNYKRVKSGWGLLMLWLGLLLGSLPAAAQSGPVGNEWIVPGQAYYKMKVVREGLYKLDYQYLTQAGISGVAPDQLQIWRRGRELATYVGGNTAVLDPTTFLEFYAKRNDGQLDTEMYKRPDDQAHTLYSFYTDTASYFITWSTGAAARPGRHMSQPVTAGSTPQPHRLQNQINLKTNWTDRPFITSNYLPWLEPNEGFLSPTTVGVNYACDSILRSVPATGPAPRVEILVFGGESVQHNTEVYAIVTGQPNRLLGTMTYTGIRRHRQTFQLLRTDISSTGRLNIRIQSRVPVQQGDFFNVGYVRFTTPQTNRWFANRRSITFQNDSLQGGPATYFYANDSIPTTVAGFDVQDLYNVQRIVAQPTTAPAGRQFVFPGATAMATHTLVLADEAHLPVPSPARRVRFRTINPAVPNFIIISHKTLMKPDPANGVTVNAPKAYATYRASAAGGRYDTLLVSTAELYDQFQYGDRSWLALRHFARWLAAANPTNPNRYLLLLGKGISPSEPSNTARSGGEARGLDLVPTSSRSISDNLITADYHSNDFAAKLRTGRLTVTRADQIMNYLAKVQEHDALGPEPWRKNVLHLVGGESATEFVEFKGYMDQYKSRVQRPLFGGTVNTYTRSVAGAISTLPVNINIAPELNAGLSLISYFGHGSNTTFDLNLGDINDAGNGYNNRGKYPVLLYDGCAAANSFTITPTFFENWLFAAGKGAIGAMGETGLSYAHLLHPPKDSLYRLLFNDPAWYGKPVTAVHDEVIRRLQRSNNPANQFNDPSNTLAVEQMLATVWHGDPSIALYAPQLPDFITSNAALSITPVTAQTTVTASSPSFYLNVGVSNPGKVTFDSVAIRVTRRYPTAPGRANDVYTRTFRQAWRRDTTYQLLIPNTVVNGVNVFGDNTFLVELDYAGRVTEQSETNNSAQINYTFLQGGLTILNPTEFAIVATSQPKLIAQTNDPAGPLRAYDFEADTSTTFNSPLYRNTSVSTTLTPTWTPSLPAVAGRDSVVWYWRVRFQTPGPDEDGSWVLSSFRVIPGSTGGWSQSHYAQLRRDERTAVDVNNSGRWRFIDETRLFTLLTKGGGAAPFAPTAPSTQGLGIIADPTSPPSLGNCGWGAPNLVLAIYDQHTLQPKLLPPGIFDVCGQGSQQFYYFGSNANSAADTLNNLNNSGFRQTQLQLFLNSIADGDYVALISLNRLRYASLPAALKNQLANVLGSRLINQLRNGDPFTLLAQKNSAGGRLIREVGPDLSSATPRYSQIVSFSETLRTPGISGTVRSTRIGPAQQWETLFSQIQRETATSSFNLKVIGIDSLGVPAVLVPTVPAAAYSLSSIPARRYPYLQLELTLKDSLSRQAPQLKQWLITYRGVPEGVVRRDQAAVSDYDPARLAQEAATTGTITFPVKFENVTPLAFGTPLRAKVELRDVATGQVRRTVFAPAPVLAGNATVTIPVSVNVIGLFGSFTTKVTVNPEPNALPELYHFNNELSVPPFTVVDHNVPPTLDVAFDGRRILNGELVSPRPSISIQLRDEDQLRHIDNRSYFTVLLKRPGETTFTAVDLNGPGVNFSVNTTNGSVATLEFSPGQTSPLADGMYTLRVQGRDPSSANAGTNGAGNSQEFEVKFEVVNASTITNVFPYPNPVTSKARFVFTLTGQELPRNLKIQIMTVTGRVVREIFMSELGPLHIGNNLSEYAWDGTDQYGDRLANGTYLYRVSLDDPSGQFSQRRTSGDQAFKNDWGKLVLLR